MTSPTIHIDEPAFPVAGALGANQFNGMTLRDYFAAKAMSLQPWHDLDDNYDNHAERCYSMADAMLKARNA